MVHMLRPCNRPCNGVSGRLALVQIARCASRDVIHTVRKDRNGPLAERLQDRRYFVAALLHNNEAVLPFCPHPHESCHSFAVTVTRRTHARQLSKTRRRKGSFDDALEAKLRARAVTNPGSKDLRVELGNIYNKKDPPDFAAAEREFAAAVAIAPNDSRARAHYGQVLQQEHQKQQEQQEQQNPRL